ncbi:hypothetical protein [Marmoricola sp. URHB0036]|uniref:hypothetical protein n=1 Tax=Marmoricola sp. URHB0036 TaxID=1298863 RepID=UPI0003F77CE3|nr:hypothetical protein [Marmoricola sp. URHB0036]
MRIRNHKRAAAAVLTAALVVSAGFAAAAQGATTDHDVRQSDFIAGLSDTRSAGHFDFLKEGLHVQTTDATGNAKVAEYYAPVTSAGLPASASQVWYGTPGLPESPLGQPGAQIVFDPDGIANSNDYNVLVGEQVYSTNAPGQDLTDWWLTGPGGDGQARAAANGYTCPQVTGGSGSNCHGTLAEWKAAVPNAKVTAYGFSLGSGVKGDGVLRSQTFGDDRFVFTDEDAPVSPPTVNPAGYVFKSTSGRTVLFQMKTASIPDGSQAGNLPTFRVTSSDSTTTLQTPAPGTSSYYANTCPKKTTCTYKAYKNNSLVYTVTIKK